MRPEICTIDAGLFYKNGGIHPIDPRILMPGCNDS